MEQGERRENYVLNLFTAIAKYYDPINRMISFNQDQYWRRVAIGKSDLQQGMAVLDAGCGTGLLTLAAASKVSPTGFVTGVDFCAAMLEEGRKRARNSLYRDLVNFSEANVLALPFPDNSFDRVISGFMLRNVNDIPRAIAEMLRVLKPGGRWTCLDLGHPTIPLFREMYYLYFRRLVPLIGYWRSGQDGKYTWLPQSLAEHPPADQLAEICRQAGMAEVSYERLTGGIAVIHTGRKLSVCLR